jgi:hypothetical protein
MRTLTLLALAAVLAFAGVASAAGAGSTALRIVYYGGPSIVIIAGQIDGRRVWRSSGARTAARSTAGTATGSWYQLRLADVEEGVERTFDPGRVEAVRGAVLGAGAVAA